MFNVINREDLGVYLDRLAAQWELPQDLVRQALERPLLRQRGGLVHQRRYPDPAPLWLTREKYRAGRYFRFCERKLRFNRRLIIKIEQVLCWLKACQERQEPWLAHKLEDGRIRRLMNVGCLDHAVGMARKDEQRAQMSLLRGEGWPELGRCPEQGEVELVLPLPHDWRWVRLKDEAAFRLEGARMRNCLARFEYARRGETLREVYSLRDGRNRPRVNVEIFRGEMVQCLGRGNGIVDECHDEAIGELLLALAAKRSYIILGGTQVFLQGSGIVSSDFIDDPLGCHINGNLRIEFKSLCGRLPEGLHVVGSLVMEDALHLTEIPERLSVYGPMTVINGHGIQHIGNKLFVGGDLTIRAARGLRRFAGQVAVTGSMLLADCPALHEMAGPLLVEGDVRLCGAERLTALPEGTRIGGSLDLRRTGVRRWPEDIEVGGTVFVDTDVKAQRVPHHLQVRIESYPQALIATAPPEEMARRRRR